MDKFQSINALTQLGDGIIHAITTNPKAIAVADGVVQFEPTIYQAITLFLAIFRNHHAAQSGTQSGVTIK